MTRSEFMHRCRRHTAGDDPPVRLEVRGGSLNTEQYVSLVTVEGPSRRVYRIYQPLKGRQNRDFGRRDALIASAMAKFGRWLTDFRGVSA